MRLPPRRRVSSRLYGLVDRVDVEHVAAARQARGQQVARRPRGRRRRTTSRPSAPQRLRSRGSARSLPLKYEQRPRSVRVRRSLTRSRPDGSARDLRAQRARALCRGRSAGPRAMPDDRDAGAAIAVARSPGGRRGGAAAPSLGRRSPHGRRAVSRGDVAGARRPQRRLPARPATRDRRVAGGVRVALTRRRPRRSRRRPASASSSCHRALLDDRDVERRPGVDARAARRQRQRQHRRVRARERRAVESQRATSIRTSSPACSSTSQMPTSASTCR